MSDEKPIGEQLALMFFMGVGRIVERITQPQFLLALLSAFILWWLTRELISGRVDGEMREVLSVLVGFITGQMVGPGWQFYFGTTQGSEKKTIALADNASTQRLAAAAGLPVIAAGMKGRAASEPVDVVVKNPYADKTDDELRQLLSDRSEDPTNRTREEMLAKLAELDAQIPTEPRS